MFGSMFGGDRPDASVTGAETVEKLCVRLESASLLEDRRSAVQGLRALAKEYQVEVGSQGMTHLVDVLRHDHQDTEIANHALEALIQVTTAKDKNDDGDVGIMFTEMFVKDTDNVLLLLSRLSTVDFHVRYNLSRLLTILLENRPKQMQQCIIQQPVGISRLMDLLDDRREVIRNQGLLIIYELTRGNADVQKIVAFENAFERMFRIIAEEGHCDGGVIVLDCLRLMHNLLYLNPSNQNYFRELSCVQKIPGFFAVLESFQKQEWPEATVDNIQAMLHIVRLLVSPTNTPNSRLAAQATVQSCGLLEQLMNLSLASSLPKREEALLAVAETIRGPLNMPPHAGAGVDC
ncbi:uncharacterized protein MONBRDRAFT_18885 [Monosiga brevicollis MX1]|uniref:Vesicle tethering protein Uso1/P115-like head domain-containing protein n=1 Tax=Monosiga brevicollis TaxID=81824 RepID=A9UY57_MONBE|nr:uncharacterized protein MONBRDRAFT_18885 [Monosiga brevicollis MX1]EDQ89963.1 predicted protein [Monosiga brevicollis MX1]|eukprot:XP_001745385.1 hypothetical protein [Monosiga brevicollis MX1]